MLKLINATLPVQCLLLFYLYIYKRAVRFQALNFQAASDCNKILQLRNIMHIRDIFTFRRILRNIKLGLRGNIDVLELNYDVTKACTIDRIQSKLNSVVII